MPWYFPMGEEPGKLFPPPATPAKCEEQRENQCRAVGKGSGYHKAHDTFGSPWHGKWDGGGDGYDCP